MKTLNEYSEMRLNPNHGSMSIGKPERTITISIERFNELTELSKWELKDCYTKNSCQTSLWENKETKEQIEGIGTYPPDRLLVIK